MSSLIPSGMYGEEYASDVAFILKPKKVLGEVKSQYQTSTIIDTKTYGRVVFQDGLIYLADKGNDAVADMHVHIPQLSGPVKKTALLIGAGDGGILTRLLTYKNITNITALDIDDQFVQLARQIMPDKTKSLDDPRVEFIVADGAEYIKKTTITFDTIAATVGDPFTISKTLFNQHFIQNCCNRLSDRGILSLDGYMPYYTHSDSLNFWDIFKLVADVFPIVRVAISTSPLMPGGLCCFIYGSKTVDPSLPPQRSAPYQSTWYNEKIHVGSFYLPEIVRSKLVGLKGFTQ